MAAKAIDVAMHGLNQIQALALTLACELPILYLIARHVAWPKLMLVGAVASCLTHPIAWHLTLLLSPAEYKVGLFWIELAVVLTEAMLYKVCFKIKVTTALLWSLITNASSWSLGWLIYS